MASGWGRRLVERRLRSTGRRLRDLRDELRVIDEQLAQLVDEADDAALRAIVSETPGVETEHRHARGHADAMAAHRVKVIGEIQSLEARQDQLLDQLTAD